MAVSSDVISIAAYPERIRNPIPVAAECAAELGVDLHRLQQAVTSSKSFVWLKRHATPKESDAVRSLGFEGIDFIPEHSRFYPNKTLAAAPAYEKSRPCS